MATGKNKGVSKKGKSVKLNHVIKRPLGDGDHFFDIRSTTVEIPVSFVQVYDNFFEVLLTIDALQMYIVFYVMMRIDGDGDHTFNRDSKEKFLAIVDREKGRTYSIGSINNAMRGLVDKGILKRRARSVYRVNPLFISRNIGHEERLELIASNHNMEVQEKYRKESYNRSYNRLVKQWEKKNGLMTDEYLEKHGGVRNPDGTYTFTQDSYNPLKGVNRGKFLGGK